MNENTATLSEVRTAIADAAKVWGAKYLWARQTDGTVLVVNFAARTYEVYANVGAALIAAQEGKRIRADRARFAELTAQVPYEVLA